MSDIVLVAMIAGASGVLGGFGPAWMSNRQVERAAQREHHAWWRERRYEAAAQLLEDANLFGPKASLLAFGKAAGEPPGRLQRELLQMTETVYRGVSRLGVLGPAELAAAAGRVGDAAIKQQTAYLRGSREEQAQADVQMHSADLAFRQVAQRVLGPPKADRSAAEDEHDVRR